VLFVEGQYVVPHEFTAGTMNMFNNVSHRRMTLRNPDPNQFAMWEFLNAGSTFQQQPAIESWPGVSLLEVDPNPGTDGRVVIGHEVTDLGNGTWHYEYAIYNMNFDGAIGAFSVPIPPGVTVTNIGFHAPPNHAPELHALNPTNDPWSVSLANEAITWRTEPFATNEQANAIRYGTMYNFRFDADTPPTTVQATMETFKVVQPVGLSLLGPSPLSAPVIVHGAEAVGFASHTFGGYIDPRGESSNGVDPDRGINTITVRFNQEVRSIGGGPISAGSFTVRQTGAGTPPQVLAVSTADGKTVRVRFNRILALGEWTTIEAHVENLAGTAIENAGDQGPGVLEPDRIDLGFLPGDVTQDGLVSPADLIRYRQILAGTYSPPVGLEGDFADTDRDGTVLPADLIAFRQLLAGTGAATRSWLLATMNNPQP